MDKLFDDLEARQVLQEPSFRSSRPIVGRLIARFRSAWNNIATRWYILPILQQQSEFNSLAVSTLRRIDERLQALDLRLDDLKAELRDLEERLIDLDQDQTSLTSSVAEIAYQVVRHSEPSNTTQNQ